MDKKKVLFVCIHNSARSQIAEAFLNRLGGDRFYAESAGLEPGTVNPLVVQVMKEIGVDISQNKAKSVFDFYTQGKRYNYVITVCDGANSQRCPVFPGIAKRLHWGFEDPAGLSGSDQEKLKTIRKIRDHIKEKIEKFIIQEK
ncbi:MAG: arsenate reductase ArsC [Candidatus Omnitrophica bacterium]|nr:arsenate reductase ArsC [Candidatus Omnitrophota bacterium]